jgi:predicted ATPase
VEPHARRRIVLTGGPGAGKTAVLELIRQSFCKHVKVLPESAGIVFGGGFPREEDLECRRAAQRAIFYVQRELEVSAESQSPAVVLCDRGTLDGLAYWPGAPADFLASVHTTRAEQYARYDAVIHLRTPAVDNGYNRQNPLRIESAAAAAEIDRHIFEAWNEHPLRFVVDATEEFLDKAADALAILYKLLPECCRAHVIPALRDRQISSPLRRL